MLVIDASLYIVFLFELDNHDKKDHPSHPLDFSFPKTS
jgi:hypothetical protein